ncbi:aminotransferase class I/II-fold pyridoxal phosphate-dependent enzyme [Spartinivicinus poritis]|uniref:Aminotransferase class I/II-fold pyridoxal phosphate-dependent enzyme n=1 Tax=Spartinivicinus poritis TaxID=2994640 RepID=A0ABT5UF93_9GAMM|nr:aminotransferase class I/II-fold pyridoxal phosphate-dependent enzyme [Spartinivicinus sp. A2-2]MDE1465063.1 aminotransferase class I/II-fold pyridoxal phosphate-dependent enzyme [Spartinivicinus sp. A2-2]
MLTRNRSFLYENSFLRKKLGLYNWLHKTDNLKVAPRTCKIGDNATVIASIDNNSNNRELIHLGSYNYSGLSGNHEVIAAAQESLNDYGTSTSGVRLLNGTTDLHIQLEDKVAEFLGTEASAAFSSGYDANTATLSTLISPEDIVFSDQLNHKSINEGLQLSGAVVKRYKHNDMEHLKFRLQSYPREQRKFIVTDGVFSMDGDICKLPQLIDLAETYHAFLIIDDAHAIGSIGTCGRGTASYYGDLASHVDIITGSFSKGIPAIGGYVAGSLEAINLIKYASGPFIFSASLPVPIVSAILKSIEILESRPEIQEDLNRKTNYFRQTLQQLSFDTMNSETPIVPILIKDQQLTFEFVKLLHLNGIFVNPVCYPAVSANANRIRTNISTALSYQQLDTAISAFEKIGKQLKII